MAARQAVMRVPVVVVLGATGAGKSKLALEIAQKFNGEIISADSMQVYHGLDIITNKVTREERQMCRHHLIDYISPLRNDYTVVDFRNKALPIIDGLLAEHKIPVIVGGTNYYIESLIWKFLIDPKTQTQTSQNNETDGTTEDSSLPITDGSTADSSQLRTVGSTADSSQLRTGGNTADSSQYRTGGSTADLSLPRTDDSTLDLSLPRTDDVKDVDDTSRKEKTILGRKDKYLHLSTSDLHAKLKNVDKTSALRIHPHDRRKIIRALEVYESHSVTMTELLEAQHEEEGAGKLSGPLRYPHTCIFWVQCDQTVLDERTDKRVDKMIEQGLIQELTDFHRQYNKQRLKENKTADYTLGIFQSIGFKEFHEYLLLSDDERKSEKGKLLFKEGVEQMKMVTRRYARKQRKWITRRFLKRRGAHAPPLYAVDSTDAEKWDEDAFLPAVGILQALLQGEEPSVKPQPCEENTNIPAYNVCDLCGGQVFVNTETWQAHLQGRRHKKALSAQRNKQRRLEMETKINNTKEKTVKINLEEGMDCPQSGEIDCDPAKPSDP